MNKVIYRDLKNATEDTIKDLLKESQGQITSNNLEFFGKLIDIHKDIANEEYWCMKEESEEMYGNYGNYGRDEYGRGNYGRDEYGRSGYGEYDRRGRDSYGRRERDSRGRYKGHEYMDEMYDYYGRYMDGRERYGASEDTKKSLKYMLESMEDFARMLKEDAQSEEEVMMIRETAQRIAQM